MNNCWISRQSWKLNKKQVSNDKADRPPCYFRGVCTVLTSQRHSYLGRWKAFHIFPPHQTRQIPETCITTHQDQNIQFHLFDLQASNDPHLTFRHPGLKISLGSIRNTVHPDKCLTWRVTPLFNRDQQMLFSLVTSSGPLNTAWFFFLNQVPSPLQIRCIVEMPNLIVS